MTEVTATSKYPCPACGAQAEWHPAKQQLVCPFCGTESPYEIDRTTGQIEEIDLVKALRALPDDLRGWQAMKRTVQCQSCRAVSVFDPERVGQNCEFCGAPKIVDYEEIKAPIRPQSLLPFRISHGQVRDDLRRWFGSKWFAPNAFKRKALVDTVKGVYIPYWTFDAHVHCPWRADAGHYYYTTERYREGGQWKTRQVRQVRWVPASGVVNHFFDDTAVPATHGIHKALLRGIEPFPTTTDLVPYDKAFVAGFTVEHYQVVLFDAAKRAQASMTEQVRQMCAAAVPGDTYRNLQITPTFSGQTFKHILVPVWLLVYVYGRKSFQVAANGYTGRIAGEYPKSFWKIFLLVMLVLAVIIIALQFG